MAYYRKTLDNLIERILKLIVKDWYEGIATGGSTSTVVDALRWEKDDYFNSRGGRPSRVYIRTTTDNAAPVGESKDVTDFVQATGTITVVAADAEALFSATVGAGDTYAITHTFHWDEVKEAINMAISAVSRKALIDTMDESVSLVASVEEYVLPSDFVYVHRVSMEDGNGNYNEIVPGEQYRIVRGATNPLLKFTKMPPEFQSPGHYYGEYWVSSDMTAGRTLRIEGSTSQPELEEDTDICFIDPTYVCYQAAAYLYGSRVERQSNDPDANATKMAICQAFADQASGGAPDFSKMTETLPPNSKRVR